MTIVNFNRIEKKYLLSKSQAKKFLNEIAEYIKEDDFYETEINNIYFDTDSSRLIRTSIEKPLYKEKLRLRSYDNGSSFIEIKKKYNKVVYKRRVPVEIREEKMVYDTDNQIGKEVEFLFDKYRPKPKMYIGYIREAYQSKDGQTRITFDKDILYRNYDLSENKRVSGKKLLDDNVLIMEVKVKGAIPLWIVKALSNNQIYPTSYSKYGEAYKTLRTERMV